MRGRRSTLLAALATLTVGSVLAAPAAGASSRSGVPTTPLRASGLDINDQGLVVAGRVVVDAKGRVTPLQFPPLASQNTAGASRITQGGEIGGAAFLTDQRQHPLVWSTPASAPLVLPLPPGEDFSASTAGLTDTGLVLVTTQRSGTFVWHDATYTPVLTWTHGALSRAFRMSSDGSLLGDLPDGSASGRAVWDGSRTTVLEPVSGCSDQGGVDLVDDGTVVGNCHVAGAAAYRPVSWDADGTAHLLPVPAGTESTEVYAGARHGWVVGNASTLVHQGQFEYVVPSAVGWHNGRLSMLGDKPGDGSEAYGVNSKGTAVGYVPSPEGTFGYWDRHSW